MKIAAAAKKCLAKTQMQQKKEVSCAACEVLCTNMHYQPYNEAKVSPYKVPIGAISCINRKKKVQNKLYISESIVHKIMTSKTEFL